MMIMAKGNPNWGQQNTVTWRFRVRGKNPDGNMVTLGSYENENEAKARYRELMEEGYYHQLRVQSIKSEPVDPEG